MLRNALSTIRPKSLTSMASLAQGLILRQLLQNRALVAKYGIPDKWIRRGIVRYAGTIRRSLGIGSFRNVAGDHSHHSRLSVQRWLDSAIVPEFRFMIPSDVIEIEAP
jgi:hypothetical protein